MIERLLVYLIIFMIGLMIGKLIYMTYLYLKQVDAVFEAMMF